MVASGAEQSRPIIAGPGHPGRALRGRVFRCAAGRREGLKALLVSKAVQVPRTHAISELLTMLVDLGFDIPAEVHEASALTDYAVAARYPGPSEPVLVEEYEKAVAVAKAVVSWVSGIVTTPSEP